MSHSIKSVSIKNISWGFVCLCPPTIMLNINCIWEIWILSLCSNIKIIMSSISMMPQKIKLVKWLKNTSKIKEYQNKRSKSTLTMWTKKPCITFITVFTIIVLMEKLSVLLMVTIPSLVEKYFSCIMLFIRRKRQPLFTVIFSKYWQTIRQVLDLEQKLLRVTILEASFETISPWLELISWHFSATCLRRLKNKIWATKMLPSMIMHMIVP